MKWLSFLFSITLFRYLCSISVEDLKSKLLLMHNIAKIKTPQKSPIYVYLRGRGLPVWHRSARSSPPSRPSPFPAHPSPCSPGRSAPTPDNTLQFFIVHFATQIFPNCWVPHLFPMKLKNCWLNTFVTLRYICTWSEKQTRVAHLRKRTKVTVEPFTEDH